VNWFTPALTPTLICVAINLMMTLLPCAKRGEHLVARIATGVVAIGAGMLWLHAVAGELYHRSVMGAIRESFALILDGLGMSILWRICMMVFDIAGLRFQVVFARLLFLLWLPSCLFLSVVVYRYFPDYTATPDLQIWGSGIPTLIVVFGTIVCSLGWWSKMT